MSKEFYDCDLNDIYKQKRFGFSLDELGLFHTSEIPVFRNLRSLQSEHIKAMSSQAIVDSEPEDLSEDQEKINQSTSQNSAHAEENDSEFVSDIKLDTKVFKFRPLGIDKPMYEKSVYDVRHAAYVLKEWLKPAFLLKEYEMKIIPADQLKKIFSDPDDVEGASFVEKLRYDLTLQRKFLKWIHLASTELGRRTLVQEYLSEWEKQSQCFSALASCFNTKDCSIFTPITEFNMPDVEKLRQLINGTNRVEDYYLPNILLPEDVERIRIWILKTFELRRQETCECCLESYLKFELKSHPDPNFRQRFNNVAKTGGLCRLKPGEKKEDWSLMNGLSNSNNGESDQIKRQKTV